MSHCHLLKLQLQAHNLDLSWSAKSDLVDYHIAHGNGGGEGGGLMMRHMGQTRTLGVLVKLHLRHDHLLYVSSLGVEAATYTVAVAKEATVVIFSVDKEEAAEAIVDVARAGVTAVSDRFDGEEVVVAVSVEAAALVASAVVMVGAVEVPAVAMMTVDAAAAIVGGNQPQNGCGSGFW